MGWLEDATGYLSRVINPQGTATTEPTPIEPSPPPAAFQPTIQPLAIPPPSSRVAGAEFTSVQLPTSKYVPSSPPTTKLFPPLKTPPAIPLWGDWRIGTGVGEGKRHEKRKRTIGSGYYKMDLV